jgi:hypothetical protein
MNGYIITFKGTDHKGVTVAETPEKAKEVAIQAIHTSGLKVQAADAKIVRAKEYDGMEQLIGKCYSKVSADLLKTGIVK